MPAARLCFAGVIFFFFVMSPLLFDNGWTDCNANVALKLSMKQLLRLKNLVNFGQGTLPWQPILWRETAKRWHTPPLLFVLAFTFCF